MKTNTDANARKLPEIPVAECPHCLKGFLAIKSISPRWRGDAVDIEYLCPRCEAVVPAVVRERVS